MKITFLPALRLLLAMTLLTGTVYPLAVTGMAGTLFSGKAQGSLVYDKDRAAGSELLAQRFVSAKYFHPRPSAGAYETVPSSASNLGPTSAALKDSVAGRRAEFLALNDLPASTEPPADMLLASGSGLDPHISPEAARLQIGRVAAARGFDERRLKDLRELVERSVESPQLALLGQPRVNVLLLNLKLDQMR